MLVKVPMILITRIKNIGRLIIQTIKYLTSNMAVVLEMVMIVLVMRIITIMTIMMILMIITIKITTTITVTMTPKTLVH